VFQIALILPLPQGDAVGLIFDARNKAERIEPSSATFFPAIFVGKLPWFWASSITGSPQ